MVKKDKLKTVVVEVEGGVVQGVQVPEGIEVIIRDYDIEGGDPDRFTKDPEGKECFEAQWTHEGGRWQR